MNALGQAVLLSNKKRFDNNACPPLPLVAVGEPALMAGFGTEKYVLWKL